MAIHPDALGDNYSIDLGDKTMIKEQIETGLELKALLENGASLKYVCADKQLKRAQIYDLIYLTSIQDRILQQYLKGKVSQQPLIKSHRKYGGIIFDAIEFCYNERLNNQEIKRSSLKVTLKDISGFIDTEIVHTAAPTIIELSEGSPYKSVLTEEPPTTIQAREAIMQINRILHDAACASQLNNALFLHKSDASVIEKKLRALEQWLDDINPSEAGQQGDPLDQSVGSYIFENMVDSPASQTFDYISQEDENQDIAYQDYNQ